MQLFYAHGVYGKRKWRGNLLRLQWIFAVEHVQERTEDALYLMEQVLLILGKAVEYLITPANITLTTDTVFYSKETGEVKIAYVPVEGEADLRKNIIRFLLQLKTELCDGKEEYLRKTAQYIYYHNYYIRDMVNKIGRFRRQLYREEHSVNQTLQGAV